MIDACTLRDIIHYDPDTGLLHWRKKVARCLNIGDEAGGIAAGGYRIVCICKTNYQSHKLAWLYVTGSWPSTLIDHKNGVRDDNRFDNLRLADRFQNRANSKRPTTNTSGVKGVTWHAPTGTWQARIKSRGKELCLGYFHDINDAARARQDAATSMLGDFVNHG